MAETNRDESHIPHQQTSISGNEKHQTSFAKSFRASIQKVSNLYEQTSRIYSRMADSQVEDEQEKPFIDCEKAFKDKTKSLFQEGYYFYFIFKNLY